MKTTIATDLTVCASEEAKICLNCTKRKCTPVECKELKLYKEKKKQGAKK